MAGWRQLMLVMTVTHAVACGVSERRVSPATPDAGGNGAARDGGAGDTGPPSGDGGSSGSSGADGASGSSGSNAACEPAVFDESSFDQTCFQ